MVIGILIALQIDNWNEQRKERERFDMVLVDVEKELMDNISQTRDNINRIAHVDAIYQKIFIDSVEFADEFAGRYAEMIGFFPGKAPKEDAFQKLSDLNNRNMEQESILEDLNGLYREVIYIDETLELLHESVGSNIKTLEKYDWFEKYISGKYYDNRVTDYFINDPEYRKMALLHSQWVSAYNYQLSRYDNIAVAVYKTVRKYLDSLEIKRSDSLSLEYDPNEYEHYLGKYDFKWTSNLYYDPADSVVVSIDNGKLNWTAYFPDSANRVLKIIPINKNQFRFDGAVGIPHFLFDDAGKVESVRLTPGPQLCIWWEKVR